MSAQLASLPIVASTISATASRRSAGRTNAAEAGDFSASLADAVSVSSDAKVSAAATRKGDDVGRGSVSTQAAADTGPKVKADKTADKTIVVELEAAEAGSEEARPAETLTETPARSTAGEQAVPSPAKPQVGKPAVPVMASESAVPVSSVPTPDTASLTTQAAAPPVPALPARQVTPAIATATTTAAASSDATEPSEAKSEAAPAATTMPDMALPLMLLVTVPAPPLAVRDVATSAGSSVAPTSIGAPKPGSAMAAQAFQADASAGQDASKPVTQASGAKPATPANLFTPTAFDKSTVLAGALPPSLGSSVQVASVATAPTAAVAAEPVPAKAPPQPTGWAEAPPVPAGAALGAPVVTAAGSATGDSVPAVPGPALTAGATQIVRAFATQPQDAAPRPVTSSEAPPDVTIASGDATIGKIAATALPAATTPDLPVASGDATTGKIAAAALPAAAVPDLPMASGDATTGKVAATAAPAAATAARGTARQPVAKAGPASTSAVAPSNGLADIAETGDADGPVDLSLRTGTSTGASTASSSTHPAGPSTASEQTGATALNQSTAQPGVPTPVPHPTLAALPTAGPAAPAAATAAAPTAPLHVVHDVALGSVPVEIGMKSLAGINHFEIRLAPNDLGAVEVKLQIDEDGRVKAHLTVDRPETLSFLQRDTSQLQQSLEQAGLKTQPGSIAMTLRDPSSDAGAGQHRNSNGGDQQQQQTNSGRSAPSSDEPKRADLRSNTQSRNVVWTRSSGVDRHI